MSRISNVLSDQSSFNTRYGLYRSTTTGCLFGFATGKRGEEYFVTLEDIFNSQQKHIVKTKDAIIQIYNDDFIHLLTL
jgi:hypothetical protein